MDFSSLSLGIISFLVVFAVIWLVTCVGYMLYSDARSLAEAVHKTLDIIMIEKLKEIRMIDISSELHDYRMKDIDELANLKRKISKILKDD